MLPTRSADCAFNQATLHPAVPIKCQWARRERRHPTASTAQDQAARPWPVRERYRRYAGFRCVLRRTRGFYPSHLR